VPAGSRSRAPVKSGSGVPRARGMPPSISVRTGLYVNLNEGGSQADGLLKRIVFSER